ncbi:MAG: hypothetical protein L3K13_02250 [Thermoplasmata archaeon]|nr:hypothetical protein [Thermoplasmata archaeon]
MTADHDCRFCACVKCYPWEEGVHNFKHKGNTVRCSCDACPAEKPYYPTVGDSGTSVLPTPAPGTPPVSPAKPAGEAPIT